jgi:hypothetical protein
VVDLEVEHRGVDGVGADHGDGDPVRAQLLGGRQREAAHRVLRGRVQGDARHRRERGQRGDVDDVPPAATDHVPRGDLGPEYDALGVDVEVPVDDLRGVVADAAGQQVAGDVTQNVDPAHRVDRLREHELPGVGLADVEAASVSALGRPGLRLGVGAQGDIIEVGGEDPVAGGEQHPGEVTADAAGTSGDEEAQDGGHGPRS